MVMGVTDRLTRELQHLMGRWVRRTRQAVRLGQCDGLSSWLVRHGLKDFLSEKKYFIVHTFLNFKPLQ